MVADGYWKGVNWRTHRGETTAYERSRTRKRKIQLKAWAMKRKIHKSNLTNSFVQILLNSGRSAGLDLHWSGLLISHRSIEVQIPSITVKSAYYRRIIASRPVERFIICIRVVTSTIIVYVIVVSTHSNCKATRKSTWTAYLSSSTTVSQRNHRRSIQPTIRPTDKQ